MHDTGIFDILCGVEGDKAQVAKHTRNRNGVEQMKIKEYKRTFHLPKVAYYGKAKRNAVSVEVRYALHKREDGTLYWEFCASGDIWNTTHTDIVCGGQCLDTMRIFPEIRDNDIFRIIYPIWERWHLNGMNAGSPNQRKALEEYFKGEHHTYEEACKYLKGCGVYEDGEYLYEGKPYRYGTAWLVEEIPEGTKGVIRALVGITKADEMRDERKAREVEAA